MHIILQDIKAQVCFFSFNISRKAYCLLDTYLLDRLNVNKIHIQMQILRLNQLCADIGMFSIATSLLKLSTR